jgi:Domain of unknown function (DUF1905)
VSNGSTVGGVEPDRARIDSAARVRFACAMQPIRFTTAIRYWNPDKASGLAVADVPAPAVEALGGLRQVRVRGTIGATTFVSSVMAAGGGRLALSVSKAMMSAAGKRVGDSIDIEITGTGRD